MPISPYPTDYSTPHFPGDTRVTVSAGTAFKIGFFGGLGAFSVGIVSWLILSVFMLGLISSVFHR